MCCSAIPLKLKPPTFTAHIDQNTYIYIYIYIYTRRLEETVHPPHSFTAHIDQTIYINIYIQGAWKKPSIHLIPSQPSVCVPRPGAPRGPPSRGISHEKKRERGAVNPAHDRATRPHQLVTAPLVVEARMCNVSTNCVGAQMRKSVFINYKTHQAFPAS